jgi:hypothetical protein
LAAALGDPGPVVEQPVQSVRLSQSSAQVGKIRRHEKLSKRDRFVCAVHVVAARVRLRFLRVGL